MRAVMLQERLEQGLQSLRAEGRPGHGEAPLDQGTGAGAQEVAGLFQRQGRMALAGEDHVEGADEVARGLGERPVEIEHRDGRKNGHRRPGSKHCQAG